MALILMLFGCVNGAFSKTIYVKKGASGNGSSWASAYPNLQPAIRTARSGDKIWVAAGTYTPTSDDGLDIGPRGKHFRLKNGVAIYGGFAGTETALSQRNVQKNKTILSGDIGAKGDSSDNCYHVFYHMSVSLDKSAKLNGVTVTAGNANGETYHSSGGGMYNSYSSPMISNCTFKGNSALEEGGGMYNYQCSSKVTLSTFSDNDAAKGAGMATSWSDDLVVSKCTFKDNVASENGGGMYNGNSSPTVTACTFKNNSAVWDGGGMRNFYSANPTVTGCTFIANRAKEDGGGISNYAESSPQVIRCTFMFNTAVSGGGMANGWDDSNPTVSNCTFSGNTAQYGGGMYTYDSSPAVKTCTFIGNTAYIGGGMENYLNGITTVTGCTFSGNTALETPGQWGGGIYNYSSNLSMTNCIVWGNSPTGITNDASTASITYTNIQGGYSGTGNKNADPLFVRTPNGDFGDPRLKAGSPCMDAAYGDLATAKDLLGNPRYDYPGIHNGGVGTPTYADMGAYETQPMMVTAPISGELCARGQACWIEWTTPDPAGNVKVLLFRGKSKIAVLKANTPNDGACPWKVPMDLPLGDNYRIKVVSLQDTSVSGFSYTFEVRIPPIEVTVPRAGKQWKRGYTYPIKWTGGKPSAKVKIQLLKAGAVKKVLAASTANDGIFEWKVPSKFALGDDYRVRVIYLPDTSMRDVSEDFSVINSAVGTWKGTWEQSSESGPLEWVAKKNGVLKGKITIALSAYGYSGTVTVPLTGTYTYAPASTATGHLTGSANGSTTVNGIPITITLTNIEGDCVNHEMTGYYSGTMVIQTNNIPLGGTYTVNR
jgi:hypothetical protein